jgi:hypothetical protein
MERSVGINQAAAHEAWVHELGKTMFSKIAFSIGGGLGWYCDTCHTRHEEKPIFQCGKERREIDHDLVRAFFKEQEEEEENKDKDNQKLRLTDEELYDKMSEWEDNFGGSWDWMNYAKSIICDGQTFTHENRPGQTIDTIYLNYMKVWEQLSMSQDIHPQ